MSKPSDSDCTSGFCATGPSPFANQPPLGLSELPPDDPQDALPRWDQIDPALPQDCYSIADALWWSHRLQTPSARGEDLVYMMRDASDAHAVHRAVGRAYAWWPENSVPGFWKSGGASRQAQLQHTPLPDAGIQHGRGTAPAQVFNLRGVEGEIALRLGQAVTAEQAAALTPETARELVDAFTVAIEWVDSRWRESTAAPELTRLADAQSHGGLLLGEWQAMEHVRDHDWSQQHVLLQVNDAEPHSFTGSHSLQDPTWLLAAWLQHVTSVYGTVPAGTVVTTGTWTGCPSVQAGDLVTVNFEGLGQLQWQF